MKPCASRARATEKANRGSLAGQPASDGLRTFAAHRPS
jgi:hypothetical protein